MTTLVLIHGGLWEEGMGAERFWNQPGITAGLQQHGLAVVAPDRRRQAPDWATEAAQIAATLPTSPVIIVAGSNGCSVADERRAGSPGNAGRRASVGPGERVPPAAHGGRTAPSAAARRGTARLSRAASVRIPATPGLVCEHRGRIRLSATVREQPYRNVDRLVSTPPERVYGPYTMRNHRRFPTFITSPLVSGCR
jgi:hypothetical protein